MNLSSVRRRVLAAGAAMGVTVGLLAMPLAADAKPKTDPPGKQPVTVMTRNLYLGADIQRPVRAAVAAQAAPGSTTQSVVVALANATHLTRAIVDQTTSRSAPACWPTRSWPPSPTWSGCRRWPGGGTVPCSSRLSCSASRTQRPPTTTSWRSSSTLSPTAVRTYLPVSIAPRADVEAPSFTGFGSADARDVRLTMRDVVLMHVEDGLSVYDEGQDVYDVNLHVSLLNRTIDFDRGYQWVDVRAGAKRFRFVNSHFEAFSSDIAFAQAAELLDEAPAEHRPTIFVCDCNSDPLNSSIKGPPVNDTLPHQAAYQLITGTGDYAGESDFTDEWLEWAPAEEGWTSGLSETVDDADGSDFDHRIDMVFARTAHGDPLVVDRGLVTGTTVASKDPATGLWPSDHGGVVLRLRGL